MQRSQWPWLRGVGALAMVVALFVVVAGSGRSAAAQSSQSLYLSAVVGANGDVTVNWRDTPGNAQDWVSVVHAGAADDTYESTWTYTYGQRFGSYAVGQPSPADYEARLYFDWPNGGYRVIDRVFFRVGAAASGGLFQSQQLEVTIGATGSVVVLWRDTPGNPQDWVSVVHAGAADDTYESTWKYTGGQRSGSYTVGQLATGDYEARIYLDWPNGGYRVVDRVRFHVG